MIVMKFGGTSVEDAAAITRVAEIVEGRREQHPVVVVSAMAKTTDRLLKTANTAVQGNRKLALDMLRDLRDFHGSEARKLVPPAHRTSLETQLDEHFQELSELIKGLVVLGELTPRSVDAISSYGERLSSMIVQHGFEHRGVPATHVDSRRCIITDSRHTQAVPNFDATEKRLKAALLPLLKKGRVPVMGGFIAGDEKGVTTTLGRGGSDFSASIIGAALAADRIEIWTDVDGMLTADPRLMGGARRVKVISFDEASELAYFGAKVLHPSTLLPAVQKKIPVAILNSRKPSANGTMIVAKAPKTANVFKSIACKTNITIVDIVSTRMLMAHGFLRAIFEVFDRYQTPVDMVTTSEVSVSLTVDNPRFLPQVIEELSRIARVSQQSGMAIVCLVGDNVRFTPGISARVFKAIENINIRMISQGASLLNISFVVDDANLKDAVSRLHRTFFKQADPKIFE